MLRNILCTAGEEHTVCDFKKNLNSVTSQQKFYMENFLVIFIEKAYLKSTCSLNSTDTKKTFLCLISLKGVN